MKSKTLAYFSQAIWGTGSIKSEFVLQRDLETSISLTHITVVMDDQVWHSYSGDRSCEELQSKNQEKIGIKIL